MTVKVLYKTDDQGRKVEPLEFIRDNNVSAWVDMRAAEDVDLKAGEFRLISLGVCMRLPSGFEGHLAPRSSTFRKWGIIQTNSVGVIDPAYSGDDDVWMMPVYATRDTHISFNDRIAQFRIEKQQPMIQFEVAEHLSDKNRSGFGSTGSN